MVVVIIRSDRLIIRVSILLQRDQVRDATSLMMNLGGVDARGLKQVCASSVVQVRGWLCRI